ncbi:MAG: hypothetical protein KDA61_18875, partial [Planctomycetales bacterium]|nr:hypothetical protein [Planctomycetales bacterium]
MISLASVIPLTAILATVVAPPANQTPLLPHRLLPLLHAAEVQQELKLSPPKIAELETFFAQVDGPWFRSRILTPDKQAPVLDELETATRTWLAEHLDRSQQNRIRQL